MRALRTALHDVRARGADPPAHRRACVKRPVSADALERFLHQIERWLVETGEQEVTSAKLGEHVLHELRELDPVAYVRFASVYRDFQDVGQFVDELNRLKD
jgi:transcriptional repressor NrdR